MRLNVKGREPRGRVAPGAEFDATIEKLTAQLLEIENAETGEPLFTEILRTDDVYDGPLVDTLPDLLAGWSRAVADPRRALGSHRHDPGRQPGDPQRRPPVGWPGPAPTSDASLPTRCRHRSRSSTSRPTIASWFGVELPDVDGRPVAEWAMAPVR